MDSASRMLSIRRLASMIAAIIVLIIELQGSLAVKKTLLGATQLVHPTSNYTSNLIIFYLVDFLDRTAKTTTNGSTIDYVYINTDDTLKYTSNAIQCNDPLTGDRIYTRQYLEKLLPQVLLFAPGISMTSVAKIIVDCSYTGRLLQDTTALMVHFINGNATTLTTIFLQTIQIDRVAKRLSSACGMATISSINLSALFIDHNSLQLSTDQLATYTHMVGIDFPYVIPAFELVLLSNPDLLTTTGMWQGIVATTNERILLGGIEGIYRSSKEIQGSYDYYIWDLPSNPLQFLTRVQYLTTDVSKDSYAWIRVLLGMGISLTLILNLGVAILVSLRMYLYQGVVWIPDVFPSVQFRIQLRGLLCIVVLCCTNWWHLFEYALCNGNARDGWTNTFVLNDIVLSDALMVYLALMISLTNWIRIRIRLEAVLIIYLSCYKSTEWFINNMGVDANATSTYLQDNYLANILEANVDGMDLWTIHENTHTNFDIIATELTWWFVACVISIVYALIAKSCNMFDRDTKEFKSWRYMHHLRLCNNDSNGTASRKFSIMPAIHSKPTVSIGVEPMFHRRYTGSQRTFSSQDINSLRFEAKVQQKLCQTYGMVAPLDEYVIDRGWMYVSRSSIWLLGYFCLCENFLLNINDYPLLLLNSLLHRRVFRVYGFVIDDGIISDEKVPINEELFGRFSIFSTSLQHLR